jgi:hypothetical protein
MRLCGILPSKIGKVQLHRHLIAARYAPQMIPVKYYASSWVFCAVALVGTKVISIRGVRQDLFWGSRWVSAFRSIIHSSETVQNGTGEAVTGRTCALLLSLRVESGYLETSVYTCVGIFGSGTDVAGV